ncbi:MAG TPA: o-succinylbenzoate synthase [Roseiflexaceae bacterium]|nr:o-succinylbenzoate synthase [Roseiflexaceae bacterium]
MMRVVRVAWNPFRIPYAAAFTTAHGSEQARLGAIIRVTADDGRVGWGEAAPLPAFGGGTIDDALRQIASLAPRIAGRDLDAGLALLDRLDYTRAGMAAAASGLDTALLDLRAQAAELPLAKLLDRQVASAVPVNATVGEVDVAAACRAAERAARAGIRCVKLKVGVAPTREAELERIIAVRATLGADIGLRIDANAAWDVPEAIAVIRAAEPYKLELVEQPLKADDLAGMAQVRAAVHTPIAADEAVGGPEQAARVIAAGAADVLVVKPMMAGGLRRARDIIAQARRAGLQALVTTTIDAGVGVAAALHLAATLPTPRACGLATGALLVGDLLVQPVVVRNGAMQLPDHVGLGVHIDERQLALYASGWQEVEADTKTFNAL